MGTAKEKSGKGKNMIVISRGYAFLLSGFILFLIFWMFVLGILVGKGVIPGAMFDIKYPINRIKAIIGIKEKIEYERPKEGSLEFYSELEKKKKDAKVENLIPVEPKLPDHEITLSKETNTSLTGTGNAARGVITPPAPKEEETHKVQDAVQASSADDSGDAKVASSEAESPVRTEPPAGHYSVQVAAIVDREMAEKMAKELVDRGFDAYYYAATINGRKTFRIMCGRFSARNDALKYHERLKNELGYNGFISKVETE